MKTNRNLFYYMLAGFLFTAAAGTLLHFVYGWTGANVLAGLLSAVSESTWEHMKLLFMPMLAYGIFASLRLSKTWPCIVSGFCGGILAGTFLIPVIFYTYTGIAGRNFMVLDILTFLLAVLAGFLTAYRLTLNCRLGNYTRLLEIAVFAVFVFFLVFTYFPPGFGLFQAP